MSAADRSAAQGRSGPRRGTWRVRLLLVLAVSTAALAAAETWLRSTAATPLLVETVSGRVSPAPDPSPFVPFDVEREPRRPRVVLLGASTEAGYPYGPRASLAAWVQRVLAWRGANIEVVPVARSGLTAEQTAALMPEVLSLHPAAIVAGLGHNEFTHNAELLETRPWMRWWMRLQLVARLREARGSDTFADIPLPTAEHDFDRAGIEAGFAEALRRMQAAADAAGVPLLFTVPVSNLLCPPALGDGPDPATSADAAFARGSALRAAGQSATARTALEEAIASDRWPQRAPPQLQQLVRQCGGRVVRTDLALQAAAPDGIPDFALFIDYCHPTPAGALVLATAIADAIEELGLAPPTGRLGRAPDLPTMRVALELLPAQEAECRGEAALFFAGLALITDRHAALAEMADRQLEAAATGAPLPDSPGAGAIVLQPSEASAWRALLALLAGDVETCRARLAALQRDDPQAAPMLATACRRYPWIAALFARHGLPLPGAG